MSLKTPIVLTIRSSDSGVGYDIQSDGTASLSYILPEAFDLQEPHAVKLLYVKGPKKDVMCCANFIEPQCLNRDPVQVLGTSINSSNVYIPLRTNYVTSVGWFIISHLDGTSMRRADPIVLALHLVPTRDVKF